MIIIAIICTATFVNNFTYQNCDYNSELHEFSLSKVYESKMWGESNG